MAVVPCRFAVKGLPRPEQVAGLEPVVRALRLAERVPAGGPVFIVCISDAAGHRIAAATLHSYDQLKRFSREVHKAGYAAQISGDPTTGCDVFYTPRAGARDIFDDGTSSGPVPL